MTITLFPMQISSADVVAALNAHRYVFNSEQRLQDGVRLAFERARIPFEEQVVLGPKERIDFLVLGRIGVELKIKGSRNDVWRQLERYAASPRIEELVLATTLHRHVLTLPPSIAGKPVTYARLEAWL